MQLSRHTSISAQSSETALATVNPSGATAAFLQNARSSMTGDFDLIQCKLSIGSPEDPLEDEADAIADKVMRMPEQSFVQRKCAHCEEEEKAQRKPLAPFIQKKSATSNHIASDTISSQIHATKGKGSSIPETTKSFMESRFGTDFSTVNIHTGSYASKLSAQLNAQAFTVGSDIYFSEGKYSPESDAGKHLLAHELTHTLQQEKGNSIQRSCSDGRCETCAGGRRRLALTAFFRTRATRATMRRLNQEINDSKAALRNCCVDMPVFFNWSLLRGGGSFDPGTARAAGSRDGAWDFTDDAENLGEGNTFSGARGIPMLIVDDVPRTGGGVTVSHDFDNQFTGTPYIVIGINQAGGILPATIAHELGHRAGLLSHTTDPNNIMDTGATVDEPFCNAIRSIAT